MASLREAVKDYQDELRDGIAWTVFWREGRSWNSDYIYLEVGDDTIHYDDMGRMEQIHGVDPRAVALNGYYCGRFGEDMTLDELTAGVRWHYENGFNSLADFIESHTPALPPEQLEAARQAARAAGLPFSERPYDGREFNPYVYDGSMTPEDYELMQQKIETERSDKMDEKYSILIDSRSRFETGEPGGVWLAMPTTTAQLHEAMKSVGITADNPQDFFINGFANTEYCPFDVPLEVIQSGSMDELNYLGKLLSMQGGEDSARFAAAVTLGERAGNLQDLINLAQNLDCYWLYPTVQSEEDYGYYLIDELDEMELPAEAKLYFKYEEYGRDAAINDGGRFTEQGYIYNNKNTFTEWYNGREGDIPKEYRVMSYPQPERPATEKADYDEIGAAQAAAPAEPQQPRPVVPILLNSTAPAEKLKEITGRLEQGIHAVFESERYKEYLNAMSKFHDYSFNNTILIAMQGGNLVKGYTQWKNEFERQVKKDEKGIKIFAPAPYKAKRQVTKIDQDTQKPVLGSDGKPVKEEQEITIPAFKVVSVFDISQTEGKEFPDLSVKPLLADVEQYEDFFAALEKASPVPIAFEEIESSANGYYHLEDKRIAIKEGVSELQAVKTAIHEIAHAKLHDVDLNVPKEEQNRASSRTREAEAESVAYTVCQHFGLDTSDYSFGYVAGWSSGKELPELKASLETIQQTAKELITEIEGHFTELQQQRETEQEAATPPEKAAIQEQTETAEPERVEQPQTEAPQPTEAQEAAPAVRYYSINETAARRAKEANSFSDYRQGSATVEYRHYVEEAAAIAERQKSSVDPMYHEKIDSLLDTYARKLAANMNKGYEIAGRVPSILIAGGSNFPVRQKEKQNAAADKNMEEWRDIQGLLDKIRSTGMGGISADDPQAVQKLESKLAGLEKSQETMKAVNAYYRKNKTLDGCPALKPDTIEKLKASMSSSWRTDPKPFESWALSNNSAEIRRVKSRIADLSKKKEIGFVGWEFEGGNVEANTEANRLQIFFEQKPDEATRAELKAGGFRWSPTAEAWQRQLNANAYYAANYVKAIQPINGEKPTDLQRAHIKAEQSQPQQKQAAYFEQQRAAERGSVFEKLPQDKQQELSDTVQATLQTLIDADKRIYGDVTGKTLEAIAVQGFTYHSGQLEKQNDVPPKGIKPFIENELNKAGVEFTHFENAEQFQAWVEAHADPQKQQEEEKAYIPDKHTTGEKIETPRGRFSVTDMSREEIEAAGYGFHHQSEDGKHLIMANGTRAFAVLAQQPENYLKHVEDTVEQNDNNFDGIINNTPQTPTVSDLEQRVKAGEAISVTDLAKAVKAEKREQPPKKRSILKQLDEYKKQAAQQPQKQRQKDLKKDLEV